MDTPDWSRASWRKSSHSGGNGGCVGLTRLDDMNGVHDTKDPSGPVLGFTVDEMRKFLDDVKADKYEL